MGRLIDENDIIETIMHGAWANEQELIDELKDIPQAPRKAFATIKFDADEIIEKIKDEYMIYRWIPVVEQLPKDNGYYLVSTDYDVYYAVFGGDTWLSASGVPIRLTDFVNAWMPLPDPFKAVKK